MNRLDRTIDQLCRAVLSGDTIGVDAMAREILDARKPKRRPARKHLAPGKTRERRKAEKAAARASTRPLVAARADGLCEVRALGGCRGALHWDHFFGRGKVPPSVELEWMLCEEHDHQKTEGTEDGNRLRWLRIFLMHAEFYGYQDAIERCTRGIAQEEGQHPARASARRAS